MGEIYEITTQCREGDASSAGRIRMAVACAPTPYYSPNVSSPFVSDETFKTDAGKAEKLYQVAI
jgi:hypothetical protein